MLDRLARHNLLAVALMLLSAGLAYLFSTRHDVADTSLMVFCTCIWLFRIWGTLREGGK